MSARTGVDIVDGTRAMHIVKARHKEHQECSRNMIGTCLAGGIHIPVAFCSCCFLFGSP